MADDQHAWGIDIGQAGLKAVRLRYSEASRQAVAVAFDYIPHAKILSQPDAVPEELIATALETFFGRNETKGDKLSISVPGQSSLAKFIKLPPVEASKVAEIVQYEARQQIPFELEEVVWDFQPLGGGVEESGFMLDAEVGLFAMKRDQVMQHLQPFTNIKQEIELIQTAPLALYNVLSFDYLGFRKSEDGEDEEEAPEDEYYIVLDMGADNTTLLVSNGQNIWIRNVPLGGNHFTRALTKDMKLTFAKAEHLKCNATRSPDPKAVFQSLRPVFNDYVSEIQRSIGFFSSVNREARIKKVLGVGNGFKLAGLQKFLQQNLQYEVERMEAFEGVKGDGVLNAPLFQENIMSFTVSYGLALQTLGATRIHTSLLPPEIVTARKIRSKKPWAVAAAAGLLASLSLSAFGNAGALSAVSESRFGQAEERVKQLQSEKSSNDKAYDDAKGAHGGILAKGSKLLGSLDKRELWLEVYRSINECLPRDQGDARDETDITKLNRVHVSSITSEKVGSFEDWHGKIIAITGSADTMRADDRATAPEGGGYVFTLQGFHLRNDPDDPDFNGRSFVEDSLLQNLKSWEIDIDGTGNPVPVRRLGISHPVAVTFNIDRNFRYDPTGRNMSRRTSNAAGPMGGGGMGMGMNVGGMGGEDDEGYASGFGQSSGMGMGMGMGMGGGMGMMGGGGMGGGGGSPSIGMGPPGGRGGARTQAGGSGSGMLGVRTGEETQSKEKIIERTDFVIQFAWKPTLKADREEKEPDAAPEGDAAN